MRDWIAAVLVVVAVLAGGSGAAKADIQGWLASHGFAANPRSTETLEAVAGYVAGLAVDPARPAVAAATTSVGHWHLVNGAGEPFTAAGATELAQALRTLAPAAEGQPARLRVFLTPDSVFRFPASLHEMPAEAVLAVVIGGRVLPILRVSHGEQRRVHVVVGPGVLVEAGERPLFDEIAWQLRRPLVRAQIRTLAFEAGGPTGIPRAPRIDAATRQAEPDAIDPGHVAAALGSLRGQLVLATGRIEAGRLLFKAADGTDGSLPLGSLLAAAASADVNLIALAASSPRQPGTRNRLWQRVAVSNVDKALAGTTLADFMHVLAGAPKQLLVKGTRLADGGIGLEARPFQEGGAAPVASFTQALSGTWSDIVSETAGSVSVLSVHAAMLSASRQAELDRRLVPGIPWLMQLGYGGLLAIGLLMFSTLRRWWQSIWPREQAADYPGRAGLALARLVRELVFGILVLPLAGLPAALVRCGQRALELSGHLSASQRRTEGSG